MFDKLLKFIDKIETSPIKIEQRYCAKLNSPQSTCSLCQDFCSQAAISISNKELNINFSKCINCGLCINSCPNQVFTMEMNSDLNLLNELQGSTNPQFQISCQQAVGKKGTKVRCLGRVSENLLLKLLLLGADSVWLKPGNCDQCGLAAEKLIEEVVNNCNKLLKNYSEEDRFFFSIKEPEFDLTKFKLRNSEIANKESIVKSGIARRDFMGQIKEQSLNSLIDLLSFADEEEEVKEIKEKNNPKRQELITLIEKLETEAENIDKKNTQSLFWQIEIEEDCNFCGACVILCPNQALELKEEQEQKKKTIIIKNSFCSNCRLCEEVCFNKQINIKKNSNYQLNEQKLYIGQKKECIKCNKDFYTVANNRKICPFCDD